MDRISQVKKYADLEIVAKILAGEAALYEIIIRKYNTYLFRVGRSYGFSHSDTEDLMQEAYVSAYTHLHTFANRSSFKTWLVKIMLNHCYQKKQKLRFRLEVLAGNTVEENAKPMFIHDESDTGKVVLNKELGQVLENALLRLPEDYRMVFSLRELNRMSTAETAEALAISESNVKVRLNRAKNLLRKEVEKMYSPEDIFEFNLMYCDRIVERVMVRIVGIG